MSGASGSGKTTLLRQLKPAIAPYGKRQGAVLYEGRPVEELEKRRAALEIGFVFQSPDAQIVTDRVSSELAFGLENAGVPPEEIRRRVAEMAGFFGIEGWYHKAIEALSGGQRQMLNLASVMVMNPKVLILDEPTSQLDPVSAGNFIGMLEKLNRELGQTILLTEHRQEELFPLADRIGMMELGRLKQALPPKEMAAALLEEQAPLSKALPTPAKIAWTLGRRADLPLTMKEGRGFLAALPPSGHKLEKANPPEPGEKILEAKNLFFRYDKDAPDVLRDFSLTLEKGRCLAVLGGNGAGKTTLVKLLKGLLKPVSGSIYFHGEDISGKLHEMMRQAIDDACTNYLNGETADDWDFAGLRRHFMNWLCLPTDFNYTTEQLGDLTKEGIADELYKRGMDILTAKEKRYGAKTMRELERICLLRNVDSKWMEHIDNMDQLKQGMGLRGYGQHDPVVEYRIEGFAMFDEMIASIREDAVHMLLTIEIRQQNAEPKREQIAKPTGDNAPGDTGAKAPAPVRVTKIGRNDPCPCGSGLKWKKCTCKEYHPDL